MKFERYRSAENSEYTFNGQEERYITTKVFKWDIRHKATIKDYIRFLEQELTEDESASELKEWFEFNFGPIESIDELEIETGFCVLNGTNQMRVKISLRKDIGLFEKNQLF